MLVPNADSDGRKVVRDSILGISKFNFSLVE